MVIHVRGILNVKIYFQASLCGHLSLYYTKHDKNVDIRLPAQAWLGVNVWWSEDKHYDRLSTNY